MGHPLTDPVFLVDALPRGDTAELTGAEGRHAAKVRRIAPGEQIAICDGTGGIARCTVRGVRDATVELDVVAREQVPAASPRLIVVQALAKGDRAELAVELMTELGVDEIVPWSAQRSVVQWSGERGRRAVERWRSTAREAAKQARRAWVPVIGDLADTDGVVTLIRSAGIALVLEPSAGTPLSRVPLPGDTDVLAIVGPEGGMSPDELSAFVGAGAAACRLGSTTLRTSTAGGAALAVLSVRLGRWG